MKKYWAIIYFIFEIHVLKYIFNVNNVEYYYSLYFIFLWFKINIYFLRYNPKENDLLSDGDNEILPNSFLFFLDFDIDMYIHFFPFLQEMEHEQHNHTQEMDHSLLHFFFK